MGSDSDFLFARPSFIEGIARVLDFGNTLNTYNESLTPEMADEIAMWLDWSMVGKDISKALLAIEREQVVV